MYVGVNKHNSNIKRCCGGIICALSRRCPFSLIKDGLQARTLIYNWLFTASSRLTKVLHRGMAVLWGTKKKLVRMSIGPTIKKNYKTLQEYKQELVLLRWFGNNIPTCQSTPTTN